jgi:hypothetical protein
VRDKRLYCDAVFFISVYSCLKCCLSLLDTTGIRVTPRNFRNSFLFTATCCNSPTARRVVAANGACKDLDISRKTVPSLKQISALMCPFVSNCLFFMVLGLLQ